MFNCDKKKTLRKELINKIFLFKKQQFLLIVKKIQKNIKNTI